MTSIMGIYQFGVWRLDPTERLLLNNGEPVALTPKAFETLLLLVENAGKLVTKQEFMSRVWPDTFVEDVAVAQNISQLRKVFMLDSASQSIIETVSKHGYRLLVPVQLVPANGNGGSSHLEQAISPSLARPSMVRDDHAPGGEVSAVPDSTTPREPGSPMTRVHRALRVAGFTGIGLITVCLLSLGILRYGSRVRAEGHRAVPFGQNQLITTATPKITPLISLPGEESMPAFSPDGSRIAFVWQSPQPGKSGVYAVVAGSQSLLRLTADAKDICPTWSPDGRYIAFIRSTEEKYSIYLVPALGGPERQVYGGIRNPWVGPEGLSFSADGKLIAFADWSPEARTSSIKSISLDDSSVRLLSSPPSGYHDTAPAFAPDGKRIAFVRSTGPIFLDELYIQALSGGEPKQLTSDHHRVFGAPVWTQNSQEILFASNRAGLKSLWRISASGGQPQPVLGPGPVADHPSISYRTGELAYEYSVEDENLWQLDEKNAGQHGMKATALFSSKTSNLMPQFSPDGSKLAFEGDRSGYEEIWICGADGSNPVQITKLGRFSGSPRWSPDGSHLVFDSRAERHSGIYTVDLADGSVRNVSTFSDSDSVVPSWSRDGRWLYFASDHGAKDFHIWKVPVAGGPPVQVTQDRGFAALESWDGRYAFYTRLSEPGVWRVATDGGAERLFWSGPGPDNWGNWALSRDGIYIIESKSGAKSVIRRVDLATKRDSYVTTLERPSFYGLTISPGRLIVYSQRDREEHDVVTLFQ